MTDEPKTAEDRQQQVSEFEQQAEQSQQGIVAEFVDFLRYNKTWWLAPIILVLLGVGLLVVVGGSGAAPFIYTLF
ncbi:MAG: DUF5989 family protein [Thermoguttaceae bacterium]